MIKVVVTRHAKKRIKQRCGLPKRAADRNAQAAFKNGVSHLDTQGRLRMYLNELYLTNGNGNNIKIYHNYVYIFRDDVLLTVIPLYSKYINYIDKTSKEGVVKIGL